MAIWLMAALLRPALAPAAYSELVISPLATITRRSSGRSMIFSLILPSATCSSTRLASSRSKRRPRSSPAWPRSKAISAPARRRDRALALGISSTWCITEAGTPISSKSVPRVWPLCTCTTCQALPAADAAALPASGGSGRLRVVRWLASSCPRMALAKPGMMVTTSTPSEAHRPVSTQCSRDQRARGEAL